MMDSNLSYLDRYISLKSSTYTEESDPAWSCFYEMTAITAAALDIFHIPSEMCTIIT